MDYGARRRRAGRGARRARRYDAGHVDWSGKNPFRPGEYYASSAQPLPPAMPAPGGDGGGDDGGGDEEDKSAG